MYETQLEFRGISRELVIEYLLSIAELTTTSIISNADGSVTIPSKDWMVTLSEVESFSIVPTVVIPRFFISFTGDETKILDTIQKLRVRTLRTGG
ncbi:hypothetical protein TEPIDINF_001274 [Tepidibacillus infernus]|uniref:hypothetical protein n=1 Tax=Tepidibacillus infernus TaxID=1806172 RepID=UPI003B6DBCC8